MKLVLASDHAAFELKGELVSWLKSQGYDVHDVGTHSSERCDYPDYARKCAEVVARDEEKKILGILLCGSGIGASMAANRFSDIRAAVCLDEESAKLSRAHNDANILCMGSRLISIEKSKKVVKAWLSGTFEGGRHRGRVEKFSKWGEKL